MKLAKLRDLGISKQRGFWLRCFLGYGRIEPVCALLKGFNRFNVVLLLFVMASSTFTGQCVYRTISVSRVQGTIFDRSGTPIPNVEISLKREGRIISSGTGDSSGQFALSTVPGTYDLSANVRGFAPGFVRLNVGSDVERLLRPTHLFMILDIGILLDNCTFTTTSRTGFEKAIQEHKKN